MDYDRYDATLHYIFKQTQGDAWFRPNEENLSCGVCLRIDDGSFRVFPYENAALEPFEVAVSQLNPAVAVKVRSAAVHACLSEGGPEDKSIYVDSDTRIQILDSMIYLPHAEKEQSAAFIRDERVLIVWSETLEGIIPTARDFEDRLIRLLWRSRPPLSALSTGTTPSAAGSVSGHSHLGRFSSGPDPEKALPLVTKGENQTQPARYKRTWYGRKVIVPPSDKESALDTADVGPEKRPTMVYAPIYNGLAAGLSMLYMGNAVRTLIMEWRLDGQFSRFALVAVIPLLFSVSLFFNIQLIQNFTMAFGPIAHYHRNSKYYSAIPPRPNKVVDSDLPHITVQMPVYKEGLEAVLKPSIESLKKAMQTYARQGGTSSIFVNDDGLRLLPKEEANARIQFYANHNIGWVSRPKHTFNSKAKAGDPQARGFNRPGRFKKASNMNYGLNMSLRMERILERLQAERDSVSGDGYRSSVVTDSSSIPAPAQGTHGLQYQNLEGDNQGVVPLYLPPSAASASNGSNQGTRSNTPIPGSTHASSAGYYCEDLEERALQMAMEEVFQDSGCVFRPWAANARSCRIGEIVLIVDSDTIVPEDCFRDAARELAECPEVGIIQHESEVMQVAHHYFENGIAYFTRRINKCISMTCANGEVAPFVGHNAFMRWKACQDAAFIDPADGQEKIWSESNVSEDFDMALRLQLKGYIIRWATYSKGAFREGVSLSVDDELNRWQKYAYGCSELLFNPLKDWWRKGPINHQIHQFMWSSAPAHYKISMLSYMFSYYGIAGSITIGVINYVLLGFEFPVDGFYMHSFEIWIATTVVFFGAGNVGYTLMQYRLGTKNIGWALLENLMWVPFFFFFFGGLGIPLSLAILAHLFSYNITWSATIKEVERSNFFKEVPKIFKRFWFPLLVSIIIIAGMIIASTPLVPYQWSVTGTDGWAVILPLS
ncbi:hypothetical protein CONPUDRAFT_158837 [Coniophora puteana RWD-64-598 SS2]|uniref:Uncharacterized protein n=1 Tax=Coniophora puteana (strain RWD-64-598) TaxID=741705 RepID=A0A5M3MAR2_CONPW|nr:uncharacterized protein CONPUDRAFT_158837 [Coniophora puteana RWD-64-598 SS2]EIW76066.1 hypothetical protein CONPUDRAFT_158837 [Coniophora puteana RWD-64-598 SS2]